MSPDQSREGAPREGNGAAEEHPARRSLFRDEALRHHVKAREFGDVVRRPPRWTRIAYPLVVVIALAGVLALGVGRSTLEARGPGVVRAEGERYAVHAFLPASFLPALKPGLPLRVEFLGHPDAAVDVTIEQLDDRPRTPEEARRSLGSAATEANFEIPEDVVVAWAALPGTTFRAADGEHTYVDGMAVAARTPIRSEPLIFSLFPGLRAAISN